MEPKLYWERKDVTICYCYNSSGHVHCPCSDCDYSAVNASTEYRHWKKFTAIYVSSDTGENTVSSYFDDDLSIFIHYLSYI